MQKNTKKGLAALAVLLVLIMAAALVYFIFVPRIEGSTDTKNIVVTVVHSDGEETVFNMATQAETLGEALQQAGIIQGEDGPYGLYILTADGETVDESRQQWWCLTKAGQQHNQGADSTVLSEGDRYELSFKEGW